MALVYSIVLADDHPLFREGVKRIIRRIPHLKVVGEVADGLELLELLKEATPQMVILDIAMPNLQGIEVAKIIKRDYPEIKVLILTMHKSKEHLHHAISAGVAGYLLKENTYNDLLTAINAIQNGQVYISPLMADLWAEVFPQEGLKLRN
jgi:DNA-binding NarL/FixJ family response regulator